MGVSANDASAATAAAPTAPTASAAAKKYHLVEAEEVDTQQRVKAPGSVTKKKGKTNWSQFPADSAAAAADESVDSTGSDDSASQHNGTSSASTAATTPSSIARRGSNGGRGSGSRSFNNGGRGHGPRRNYDSNGTYINGVYVPNTDPKITAQYAKEQIEFYFSPDNLVRDIFLRQHMDVDGFVPLAFVGSFQAVFAIHQDYASLLDAMHTSESVELDVVNEKVRLRDGWQQWLWPNADGGYGVPAYIKATAADADVDATSA